jgi:hypothetical protein
VLRRVLAAGCGQFPTGPTTIGHFVRTKEKYFLCDLFGVEKIVTKKCRTIVFYLFYFIAHANHRAADGRHTDKPADCKLASRRSSPRCGVDSGSDTGHAAEGGASRRSALPQDLRRSAAYRGNLWLHRRCVIPPIPKGTSISSALLALAFTASVRVHCTTLPRSLCTTSELNFLLPFC